MMPLTLAGTNEDVVIRKVGGKSDIKIHLGEMGFVPGERVRVVSKAGEGLIVKVKDSRLAIGKDLAKHIMI